MKNLKNRHIVVDSTKKPNILRCNHCGAEEDIPSDRRGHFKLSVFEIVGKEFTKKHKNCKSK